MKTYRVYWSGSPFEVQACSREHAEMLAEQFLERGLDEFTVMHVV
jgi:hypothetical protein